MTRLAGKVAFITGAARGIGRACAERFAAEGASVAAVDIAASVQGVPYEGATLTDLHGVTDGIVSRGGKALAVVADVRKQDELEAAANVSIEQLGQIDVLVAAAGIDSWGVAWELTEDQWQAMLDINLSGVWRAAKVVIPHMLRRNEGGSLVFIGSVLSRRPNRDFAHYTVAKHGVKGLVRALALELAPHRIRVNAVDPTSVATDMIQNQAYRDRTVGHPMATVDEVREAYKRWNALPVPWIESVDVAHAALFLASDEARYITGTNLPVDAGALLT